MRLRVFNSRLRGLMERGRRERELDEEIRFHLEAQIADNLKRGMNAEDARDDALRKFGSIESMKERYRDGKSFRPIENAVSDVRFALRILRRSPAFTLTSITVLALGIGATTAMFSLLNAILFRPLPYRAPDQLVMLWSEAPSQALREGRSAYQNVQQWRLQNKSFEDLAFFDPASAILTGDSNSKQVSTVRVSANFFDLLGVQPLLGRTFTAEEVDQRQPVALVSERLWWDRFAGSAAAVGASIELDGIPVRIIGVIPESLRVGITGGDLWQPNTMAADWDTARAAWGVGPWFVVSRLRSGVSLQQAQSEMQAIASHLNERGPHAGQGLGVSVVPLDRHVTGTETRRSLLLFTGAVLFVLLIAAANVAALTLARSASREREIAVRMALGAGQGRIAGQLLAESFTLAAISGIVGLIVAQATLRLGLASLPSELARVNDVRLEPAVLGGAFCLCLLVGIIVGVAPAISLSRRNRISQEGSRSIAGGRGTHQIRSGLVVAQFSLAIVLLVGAGLLIRSLWLVERVDLGFHRARVLLLQISNSQLQANASRVDFCTRMLEQVESLPGVESAAVIGDLFVGGNPERIVTAEGDSRALAGRIRFRSDEVSERFFQTVGAPLRKGRFFTHSDGKGGPPVAIVNDAMAHRLWPESDPLGKRFKLGPADSALPWFTVVGVVGDMRRQALENEPIPQMFEPFAQNPSRLLTLLVRTSAADPFTTLGAVRTAVQQVDKRAPVYGATTIESRLNLFLSERRFATTLLLGFAITALLMAAIGIYGLIQYSIALRTHEIGVRMAIGAQPGQILRMILAEGVKLTSAGMMLGLVGALWIGKAVSSSLFGVTSTDATTFLTVSLALLSAGAAATYIPARRAAQIAPVLALRHD